MVVEEREETGRIYINLMKEARDKENVVEIKERRSATVSRGELRRTCENRLPQPH
jgi:hypothetical protein